MEQGWDYVIHPEQVVVNEVHLAELQQKRTKMEVLRLDRLHPVISGNKYYKLKYYVDEAIGQGKNTLVTSGGAFSNHIVATACAAHYFGLNSIGIIRGEAPPVLSHTLQNAKAHGMELRFVSRQAYSNGMQELLGSTEDCYTIPAGGEGPLGVKGASEMLQFVKKVNYSHIICAMGTGTMFRGICEAALEQHTVVGIPVLKGFDKWQFLADPGMETTTEKRFVFTEYHWGGYAKSRPDLFTFMNDFYRQTGISTDFVYTGKLLYAAVDLLRKRFFPPDSRLLVIHSGGLQGNESLPPQTLDY